MRYIVHNKSEQFNTNVDQKTFFQTFIFSSNGVTHQEVSLKIIKTYRLPVLTLFCNLTALLKSNLFLRLQRHMLCHSPSGKYFSIKLLLILRVYDQLEDHNVFGELTLLGNRERNGKDSKGKRKLEDSGGGLLPSWKDTA